MRQLDRPARTVVHRPYLLEEVQDVLRAQIEQDRLKTDLASLEDSRNSLLAQFKAALGLGAAAPAPPVSAGASSQIFWCALK